MKIGNTIKTLCALFLILAILISELPATIFVSAESTEPSVIIDNCGSRLNLKTENIANPTFTWQIADTVDGTYLNISGATEKYYDITADDEGKYIRVVVNGTESEPVGPIGKLVVFDLAKGTVTLSATYIGKDVYGNSISGSHAATNVYVVMQSENERLTTNKVLFTGDLPDKAFDVTLDGVNIGLNSYSNTTPDSSSKGNINNGLISIVATSGNSKDVTLRIKGKNIVRYIQYYTNSNQKSSLKITDINGDNATDGGKLYLPIEVAVDKIDEFVKSSTNYNHWNSAIGGDDYADGVVTGLHIAGSNIQALSTYGDNCSAIGGGGNGYCQMQITGGNVIAHCSGTGAAIGGGIGWNSYGGKSDILISGGYVYAKNHGEIKSGTDIVGGVAIGSGSSFKSSGSEGKVTITGGTVEAYGTFGNGIGGGNSSSSTGGKATVNISGGKVTATSIGGGNSKSGVGGAAEVKISDTADVTLSGGIGGGDSQSGAGGAATITVTGGYMNCGGVIGGGNGGGAGAGGEATITINNGTLLAKSIGGGTGGTSGNGGAAKITVSDGTIETGSIGGGSTLNPSGKIGYATADISGGDITGQFLMVGGGTDNCTFTMTGGTLHGVNTSDTSKYEYTQKNGAAVYMDDPDGVAELSGGTIEDCSAENGGAIYMTAGTFTISGTGAIKNCTAIGNGGAVYLGGGTLNINGGEISRNKSSESGGAVYLGGGEMHVTAGAITGNIAEENGGGAFVNGGNVTVSGGSIISNIATSNGGGIAVNNGNYFMTGGSVDKNESLEASGGGIYVSADGSNVRVEISSGSVSGNYAKVSGGALAVVGQANGQEKIETIIGVNKEHFDEDGNPVNCEHNAEDALTCPVINNNKAQTSGGAIYVTGNENTSLNIYCLKEEGSLAGGENGQSNFMKVEGGNVTISASENSDKNNQNSTNGNVSIMNSMYVTGGEMEIWGEMTNPRIQDIITVDIKKETDSFNDYRKFKDYYKLIYYENFTDPTTKITTGQYKEKEIKHDGTEIISGNIYSHPGYNIVGWNTDPNGEHNYPQGEGGEGAAAIWGWYDTGKEYKFNNDPIGDLILYAIWEANGYTVIYDPNVPVGESYTGSMENQIFTYDLPITLYKNQYGRPGYTFEGWSRNPEGGGILYSDEQQVTNLTTKKGEVVTLYAQWTACDHNPETHVYTYSVVDEGTTLMRECSCGKYSETAHLFAEDTVYDREEHPAEVRYSSEWHPEVVYEKDDPEFSGFPVNAGTYTASVTEGGETASVTYIIEKAEQPAPEKPEFEAEITESSTELKVKPVDISDLGNTNSEKYDSTYNSVREYQLVYYEGDEKKETEWIVGQDLEGGYAATFKLDIALTNYYVYARYSEGTNYKASQATPADSVYFFAGDVEVYVSCGEGVEYDLKEATGSETEVQGIILTVSNIDDYYIPSGFVVELKTTDKDDNAHSNPASLTGQYPEYNIEGIPNNSRIYITIPDAKKKPVVDAKITEKQVFSQVTDAEANISRDSAYTAYFEISDYDTSAYTNLNLKFNSSLPAETNIILLDMVNKVYYWVPVETTTDKISLTSFIRMGTENVRFELSNGDIQLQVVVDFSEVSEAISGDGITTTLVADKSDSKAPEVSADVDAKLYNVDTFGLTASGSDLSQTITYKYNKSEGIVSKWDNRQTALVLTPKSELPEDLYISFTDGTYTTMSYANADGKFIIPLAGPVDGEVKVILNSKLFTGEEEYKFDVTWLMAESVAETSPLNGDVLARIDEITFTGSVLFTPSIKVEGDKRLYAIGETVNSIISWKKIPLNYDIVVTLMVKSENGEYSSTSWDEEIDVTSKSSPYSLPVPLGGQNPGSYCLKVTVETGLIIVTEANYYFIIE